MSLKTISDLINVRQYLYAQVNGITTSIKKENVNKVNRLIGTMDNYIISRAMKLDLEKLDDYEMLMDHMGTKNVTVRSTDEEFEEATRRVLGDRPVVAAGTAVISPDGSVVIGAGPTAEEQSETKVAQPVVARTPPATKKETKKGSFKRSDSDDDE